MYKYFVIVNLWFYSCYLLLGELSPILEGPFDGHPEYSLSRYCWAACFVQIKEDRLILFRIKNA